MNPFIFLSFYFFLNCNNMDKCYEIKSQEALHKIVKEDALNIVRDGKRLAKYRSTTIFHLKNGQIVVVPNYILPNSQGLLVKNDSCLADLLKLDNLPVENPEKDLYECDTEHFIDVANNISYFVNYLNSRTGLKYAVVDKDNYKYYYDSVVKIYNSGDRTQKDGFALLIVAGEIIRKERKGKWLLIKESGIYNPFYAPAILLDNDEYIDFTFYVLNRLTHGLEYDDMYMKDILNVASIHKIDRSSEDEYIIFNQ
jgi:hypothetical protein